MEPGVGAINFLIIGLKGILWIASVVFLAINLSKAAIWLENRNDDRNGFPVSKS